MALEATTGRGYLLRVTTIVSAIVAVMRDGSMTRQSLSVEAIAVRSRRASGTESILPPYPATIADTVSSVSGDRNTMYLKSARILSRPGLSGSGKTGEVTSPSIRRDQSPASNALRAHDDVVHVAALLHWRSGVPVILEEHRVESVGGETTEPVDVPLTCLDKVVDPQLEHTVVLPWIVEPCVRLYAVPLAHPRRREDRRRTAYRAEPAETRKVVVR